MFIDLGGPIRRLVNDAIEALLVRYGDGFDAVGRALLQVLLLVEAFFRDTPPALLLLGVFALAFALMRRLGPALVLVALLYGIGCLGLWGEAMQTLALLSV